MNNPELLAMLKLHPDFFAWVACVFGACVGSFANVFVLRMDSKLGVVYPNSHCFSCGSDIAWYDNIPVLSWLLLRGRCRKCKNYFSPRYLLTEILFALVAFWLFKWEFTKGCESLHKVGSQFFLFAWLYVLLWSDLRYRLLPDELTLGVFVGVLCWKWSHLPMSLNTPIKWPFFVILCLFAPYALIWSFVGLARALGGSGAEKKAEYLFVKLKLLKADDFSLKKTGSLFVSLFFLLLFAVFKEHLYSETLNTQLMVAFWLGSFLVLFSALGEAFTGSEALGQGDIKLFMCLGLVYGSWAVVILFIACALGGMFALIGLLFGKKSMPFAPFIAGGVLLGEILLRQIEKSALSFGTFSHWLF